MPLVSQLLGSACLFYTLDKGLAGGASSRFQPARQGHHADVPNYTDLSPVTRVSEVIVGQPQLFAG